MSNLELLIMGVAFSGITLSIFLIGLIYLEIRMLNKRGIERADRLYPSVNKKVNRAVKEPVKPFANSDEKIWMRENEGK